MAKDLQVTRDNITLEEQPEEFCKQIYSEASQRNDDLKDVNEENRLFYEGIDKELESRKVDPLVQRSGLFIHELKPAIDTRKSDVLASLEEREFPITFRADFPSPTPEQKDQALFIEREINQQLRDCGYLSDGFGDHILASEIYRSPATVKVGWETVYEKEAVVKEPTEEEIRFATLYGQPIPTTRVVFRNKEVGGRPYVELLAPDEFLYQPSASAFQKDSEFSGHEIWVSWNKLMVMADEYGWDKKLLRRYREELRDVQTDTEDSFEKGVQDNSDAPWEKDGYRDGKILVVEWFIPGYNDLGEEVMYQPVMVGNKYIVNNTEDGKIKYSEYKGIKHPYVPASANRFPGTLEGLSSVDIGKMLQRLYNELFNQYLDGTSYRIFPPLVREPGTEFQKQPKWQPGAIWDVSNPDGLRPLVDNPGPLPDLPSLMQAVAAKMRHVLNAEDISQGFQAQQYEKATSTQLRVSGSAKRSLPIKKRYGQVLIEVARMVLALNQQYHPEAIKFVLPVVIDVPSLTAVSDPENEKQEALLLLAQAAQSELYQSPLGMRKIRNLYEEVYRKFKKVDIDRYLPTEQELEEQIKTQTELAIAAQKKQAIQEQMAIQGGQGGIPVQ